MKAKKSLGQNFLIDKNITRRIIDAVKPLATELIVEVGPGHGALTELLVERAGLVLAIEIDRELVELLTAKLPATRLKIVEADILQVDLIELINRSLLQVQEQVGEPAGESRLGLARVVANLPYYISTAVLTQLIHARKALKDMTLMLQREVAERISSAPGSKDYGVLSVLAQLFCETRILFHVPPGAFRPAPKVDSSILRLTVRAAPLAVVSDELLLIRVLHAAFAQRRKTILNSLKANVMQIDARLSAEQVAEMLSAANILPMRRAETLTSVEFAALSEAFYQTISTISAAK